MGLQTWNRWARACAWGGIALYAAFVLAAPALHHDFACHQTAPTHCPSCVASVASPDIPSAVAAAAIGLIDAGSAPAARVAHPDSVQADDASGRAPPASFL